MKHVCNLMSNKKIGASIGMIYCGNWYKNFLTRMRAIEDLWMIDIASLGRARISDVQFICGANYSFKRKAWKDVGGHGKTLIEDAEIASRLQNKGWNISITDAAVWQEEVENLHDFVLQRLRWYSTPLSFIFRRNKIAATYLSIIPWFIQVISLFSLIAFVFAGNLFLSVLSLVPLLISVLALSIGLVRMKEKRLIPFILPYLTYDAAISFTCFALAKILNIMKKEVRWVRLSECRYYHNGTKIRIDGN
ncbi:hypothetical protein A3K64_01580 [Candidatus Micrarchaeota archaeon RBG_16_36_9]|nr:MAG: hypothetical protein A3K64_01580 [Candidatus Micrarchaeota archaeon RBG_16_36_9]